MPGLYFGEELAYWMYEKGCSPAAIANKLGRSEDAVRKWIKQERKPDDKSIVPSIASLLGSEKEATYMTEALSGAYDRTHRDWGTDLIKRRSIKDTTAFSVQFRNMAPAGRVLLRAGGWAGDVPEEEDHDLTALAGGLMTRLGEEPVIRSREDILQTVTQLINELDRPNRTRLASDPAHIAFDRTIVLTFQSRHVDSETDDRALVFLRQTLYSAMRKGWDIVHLLYLNRESERLAQLIDYALKMLAGSPGQYRPYWVQDTDALPVPATDYILLPHLGLQLMETGAGPSGAADVGLVILPGPFLDVVREHIDCLFRRCAPLITTHDRSDFDRVLLGSEQQYHDRRLIKRGLSALTRPPAWYTHNSLWVTQYNHEKANIDVWNARHRTWTTKPGDAVLRDVCPHADLEAYVLEGRLIREDIGVTRPVKQIDQHFVLEHLHHLLTLLDRENYQLALVRDQQVISYFTTLGASEHGTFCEIIGERVAFLEVWHRRPDETVVEHDIYLAQPFLVAELRNAFDTLWATIDPIDYDKQEVRARINGWICYLQHKLRLASPNPNGVFNVPDNQRKEREPAPEDKS